MARSIGRPDQALVDYLKATRRELRQVNWPSQREWFHLSGMVLIVTFLMAAVLGIIDFIFTKLFSLII